MDNPDCREFISQEELLKELGLIAAAHVTEGPG